MPGRWTVFASIALAASVASVARSAAAQPTVVSPDAGADAVTALEQDLAKSYDELFTGDCAVACRALSSMQRSADRLCAIEPGPRCEKAREKVREAENRVRETCPGCVRPVDEREAAAPKAVEAAQGPPAEAPTGGGCAGCTVSTDGAAGGALVAAAWSLLAWARSRSRRRRTPSRTPNEEATKPFR